MKHSFVDIIRDYEKLKNGTQDKSIENTQVQVDKFLESHFIKPSHANDKNKYDKNFALKGKSNQSNRKRKYGYNKSISYDQFMKRK